MFEKFVDNPTQIRKEEVLDNNSLCNYLINFLDIEVYVFSKKSESINPMNPLIDQDGY